MSLGDVEIYGNERTTTTDVVSSSTHGELGDCSKEGAVVAEVCASGIEGPLACHGGGGSKLVLLWLG